jgi:hypothetical protein
MALLAQASAQKTMGLHYYRSQSLISPDQRYAAYSRLQFQVYPEAYRSHLTSLLFVENLQTGDLQAITPASPLAENPFLDSEADRTGHISIVLPVSWSERGDRLLAREFESLFGSDIASDYAVIVEQQDYRVSTVAPTSLHYTTAILLGWSLKYPDRALFRVGMLGDETSWHLWAVDARGQMSPTDADAPTTFGQVSTTLWTGPQTHL